MANRYHQRQGTTVENAHHLLSKRFGLGKIQHGGHVLVPTGLFLVLPKLSQKFQSIAVLFDLTKLTRRLSIGPIL